MYVLRVEIWICPYKFLFSIASGVSFIWYGHLAAAYLKAFLGGVRLAANLIHILLTVFFFPWASKQLTFFFSFFFLSLVCLTNFAQYYSSCHSSCKTDLAAAKMQSEVSTMIGKYLSTGDRLHGSSSVTFYLEIQTMRAVAHCIWYTQGTAVVSVATHK